jgi:hypothetical protein
MSFGLSDGEPHYVNCACSRCEFKRASDEHAARLAALPPPDENICRVCGEPMNGERCNWHPVFGAAHMGCVWQSGKDRKP